MDVIPKSAAHSIRPLAGFSVISLALNLPGPLAVAQLRRLGASVAKVEPPAGDELQHAQPQWYRELHEGLNVVPLDLKTAGGREELERMLARCDLLVTAFRRAALERLGLAWSEIGSRYPKLCQVAFVGDPWPLDHRPGHDLNYQARAGLLEPPNLPKSLFADLGGALQAVSAALAVLLNRERNSGNDASTRYVEVSLAHAAKYFAEPLRYGVTVPTGPLGGALARYNLYQTRDGWIALAALEPHLWQRFQDELGLSAPTPRELERVFAKRTADEWERWAAERNLPISPVIENR